MYDNVVPDTPNIQSESLHREAYNAVFREFDVDYNWSPEYYDELQNKVCVSCHLVCVNSIHCRTYAEQQHRTSHQSDFIVYRQHV